VRLQISTIPHTLERSKELIDMQKLDSIVAS